MSNPPLVFKTITHAWVYDGDTDILTPISDASYTDKSTVTIAGASQSAYNGEYEITRVDAKTFTYTVAGSPTTPASATPAATTSITRVGTVATVTKANHGYNTGEEVAIANAAQTEYNGLHEITKLTANTFTFIVTGSPATPATEALKSVTSITWAADVATVTCVAHGYAVGETVTITSATQADYNGAFPVVDAATEDTFTYALPESPITPATGTITATRATKSITTLTRVDTTATATTSAAHGYTTGDTITIAGATQPAYNGAKVVTVTGVDTFTYTVSGSPTTPATGTKTATEAVKSVTTITRTTTTATVTCATHGYTTGDTVTIAGAGQSSYNGARLITVTDTNTFTYTVTVGPVTPATGTIKAAGRYGITVAGSYGITVTLSGKIASHVVSITRVDTKATVVVASQGYVGNTVRGLAYLDGTYYVMDSEGTIYGSDIQDPYNWDALNFINPEVEYDGGVAIAKYLNYLLAFGTWSTEVFYDAANLAPGSPLSKMDNAFVSAGCASAESIVLTEGSVLWVAQAKEGSGAASAGRSVLMMTGFQTQKISTVFVERILNADNMSDLRAFAFKQNGHSFYVLTLADSDLTLVYDFSSQLWFQWTSQTVQSAKSVTGLSLESDGITATATVAAHGYSDGDPITIAGANQSAYNGTYNITYVDSSHFSYIVAGTPATPGTGTITATGYTEGHFRMMMQTAMLGVNYFIDESNGTVYKMLETDYDDDGAYINFLARTTKIDGNVDTNKRITRLDIIGDKVDANALVRYSKDDYATFSKYRTVDLSSTRSKIDRLGLARRPSVDVRVTDNIPLRLERLDLTIEGMESDES